MTGEQRAELRRGIRALVSWASGGGRIDVNINDRQQGQVDLWSNADVEEPPPLSTAQQLALSVLLGDEGVLPQALADYVLDSGTEYATTIQRLERERIAQIARDWAANDVGSWSEMMNRFADHVS